MAPRKQCALCVHACTEGPLKEGMTAIKAFIIEASGQADEEEIAHQVANVLNNEMCVECDEEQVLVHMREHMLDRRLVMSNIVKDLLNIANVTRDSSLYIDDGAQKCIDTKVLGTYLKTVDSITGIYRSVNFDK